MASALAARRGASELAGGAGAAARALAAGACDRLLDFALVAFAAWTVVYHVCLVLGVRTGWAAGLWAVTLVPGAWFALRRSPAPSPATPARAGPVPVRAPRRALLVANLAAALAAGVLFAFASPPWVVLWLLWLLAAAGALAWTVRPLPPAEPAPVRSWAALEVVVVAAWAVGLAVLSLFIVGPDGDDAFYAHLSSWIAAHGRFPLHDVLFSDDGFPALYFPPASSYEALVGTAARVASVATPNVLYYAVPPLATFLSVLALWRALRAWRAPMTGLALSVALLFLVFDATHHNALGSFFVARMWQGKVLFLAILVPLLSALLVEYARAPGRRRLALLTAAGAAGVGLSTSAIFLVPIVVAGHMAPVALRSLRRAGAGLAAGAGYPLAVGVATIAVGGRTPDVYTAADVVPYNLAHLVLGTGVLALIAVVAVLAGPALLRGRVAAPMLAATTLLVGLLLTPGVPLLIFHLTGLGRVLWRLAWALCAAALVGVLATAVGARLRPAWLRALPAVAVGVAIVVAGQPLWSSADGARLVDHAAWKRPARQLAAARRILAHARAGDVILAPRPLGVTLLVLSGTTTAVSPRGFYTGALRDVPAAHVPARRRLQRFDGVASGLRPGPGPRATAVRRALTVVGVDLVCVAKTAAAAQRVVRGAGYSPVVETRRLRCLRRGG